MSNVVRLRPKGAKKTKGQLLFEYVLYGRHMRGEMPDYETWDSIGYERQQEWENVFERQLTPYELGLMEGWKKALIFEISIGQIQE